jgi:hypothetical protein
MVIGFCRAICVAIVALALNSCQPPDRDIVVVWRDGQLVVDFPGSLWKLVGLQDRTYCIRRVELFEPTRPIWTLEMKEKGPVYHSCLKVTMPLRLGTSMPGFVSKGQAVLRSGVTYGLVIDGIGRGRVDFTLRGHASPKNETDWRKQIDGPLR